MSRAFAEAKAALVRDPESAEAHYRLGLLWGQGGEIQAAEEQFRDAIRLKPSYAEAHFNLALTSIAHPVDKLNWPEAADECRAALKYRPDYPEALNLLGVALVSMNQTDGALPLFRRAIQVRADYPEAHLNLGMALEEHSQMEAAMAEYRRALASRPAYAEAHVRLAKCLLDEGKTVEARSELDASLRINPDLAEAHYALARLYLASKNERAAKVESAQVEQLSNRRIQANRATFPEQRGAGRRETRRHEERVGIFAGGSSRQAGLFGSALQSGTYFGGHGQLG